MLSGGLPERTLSAEEHLETIEAWCKSMQYLEATVRSVAGSMMSTSCWVELRMDRPHGQGHTGVVLEGNSDQTVRLVGGIEPLAYHGDANARMGWSEPEA